CEGGASLGGGGELGGCAAEEEEAEYGDVARRGKRGMGAMMRFLEDKGVKHPPYAPPFLKAGNLVIAQTAMILYHLGPRLGLAPRDEAGAVWGPSAQASP